MSVARKPSTETRKGDEHDLEGEVYFKRAFAHAAIGLAVVDLEGHFTYTNAAYSKITGYTARELKKVNIGALMRPEDAEVNAVLRKRLLDGEIPGYVLEKRYIRKDGSLIWVKSSVSAAYDRDGKLVRIVGLTEDIDERHRAEEALRKSESRFRFMAESMPPKVFTATPKGAISYLSPQWTLYTGLKLKDMNYENWTQTVHPDDREANMKAWQRSVHTGEPFYFEHRLRRADGMYRWHVSRAYAMQNDYGDVIEWIGSDTDIEELREGRNLQSRLRIIAKQREQLISTNRLKDDFILLASHQLRTPATGVKQYIGMLLQGYSDAVTEDQEELLKRAYESNEQQLRIVNDLLRVARVDAGRVSLTKSSCELVDFIRSIVAEQCNVFYHRQQSVVFAPSHKTLVTSIDTDLMRVVLENLLDNASKYSPAGKTTTVGLLKDSDALVVQVKDDGIGIRKKDQRQLFQKFSRFASPPSETDSGTGLGLYWAKKIVELHGGTLEVASRVRQGSTFSIRLPAA